MEVGPDLGASHSRQPQAEGSSSYGEVFAWVSWLMGPSKNPCDSTELIVSVFASAFSLDVLTTIGMLWAITLATGVHHQRLTPDQGPEAEPRGSGPIRPPPFVPRHALQA